MDCQDKSDEIDCAMIEIDRSYIKDIPAPPKLMNILTEVNISVDIFAILEINEVDSLISIQFQLDMTWFDPR